MINPEICTEEEIRHMVHSFYDRIRGDEMLGPIFNEHIAPEAWGPHLATMCHFWSSLLRGTARYSGTPMTKHAALPELSAEHFQHWLQIFEANAAVLENQALATRAVTMSRRIARSLWLGYQTTNFPDRLASDLALPA